MDARLGAAIVGLLLVLVGCGGDVESRKDWSDDQCAATRWIATGDDKDAAEDAAVDYSLHC